VSEELIPLARPDIGAREEEHVLDVLRSRRLSLGPKLPQFERALGEFLGAPRVSAVSSGTAALHSA
jgi:perosamine synthetase